MLCPLAGYPVDEKATRIAAGLVSLIAASIPFVAPDVQFALAALLILDFAPRAFSRPRLSPFSRLASALLKRLAIKPRKVDAGPKRFAARIGLAMLLAMAACLALGSQAGLLALAGMLAVCATLESVLGFCVGCWIWGKYWQLRHRDGLRAG